MFVDTGCQTTSLSKDFAKSIGLDLGEQPSVSSHGVGDTFQVWQAEGVTISIDGNATVMNAVDVTTARSRSMPLPMLQRMLSICKPRANDSVLRDKHHCATAAGAWW